MTPFLVHSSRLALAEGASLHAPFQTFPALKRRSAGWETNTRDGFSALPVAGSRQSVEPRFCGSQIGRDEPFGNRAEHLRKNQRAIAAGAVGEEGELVRVRRANAGEPLGRDRQRFVPSISTNSPDPLGPTRFNGSRSRAGDSRFMIPADPLARSTPRFTGLSQLPSV
jgi:hypothetical protein